MTVLFIRFFPLIDGSLTLKMRLAKKLCSLGHQTYFLFTCTISSELTKEIEKISPVFYLEELEKQKLNGTLPHVDYIHAGGNGDDIYRAYDIKAAFFKDASVVFCAWASNAFIHTSKLGFSPDGIFYKHFFRLLPERNIAFPGEGVILKKHREFFKKNFSSSFHVSNGLDIPQKRLIRGNVNKKKLVTITRLAPCKEYVFPLVDVVNKLYQNGYKYELHIYGDGPFFNELVEKVEKGGMERFIFLHGELPYSKVNETLLGAGYFIGMGGAIIEAAALGIPSIQAIEYHLYPTVYGWFHDLNDGDVGEYDKDKLKLDLYDILATNYDVDSTTYDWMSQRSYESAQLFSIDRVIDVYIEFLKSSDKHFTFHFPLWKRLLLKITRQPFKLFQLSPLETIRR